ncbi:tryptophan-2-monooxygenase [Fusarium beomiforme]|uniref:Tryptophan-2-monooxygenase n=1 Tax=Fusarium beomiforme TaxID=44412 RepID=A0A9P5DWE7_9HYPO|nr:tryptophan-2-monooxygenase [Fusarium beomiforme]
MRFFNFNKRSSPKHPNGDRTISSTKPHLKSHYAKRQTSKAGEQKVRPQAWVDTPQIVYSEWNQAAGGIDEPLGTLPSNFSIALVGGGITNVVLAFNLKAGADVTMIEATDQVGGRLRTIETPDGVNVAEMGAMRFPPSEDLLYYYANAFNYTFIENFPDPGKVPTIVFYQETPTAWISQNVTVKGFEKVRNDWGQLISRGLTGGSQSITAATQLTKWLSSADTDTRSQVIPEWQKYLDEFGNDSFYTALQRIFGEKHEWDVPGGQVWTEDDFERFGTLGVGSGGFGAVYSAGFNSIFRLIVNGLESDQAIFAKMTDNGLQGAGIRDLAQSIWEKATDLGLKTKFDTVAKITSGGGDGVDYVVIQETPSDSNNNTVQEVEYDFAIVGTSNRAMNYAFAPVSETTNKPIMSSAVKRGITDLHMTSSSKLFIRTKKFWDNQPADFPRVILSDTDLPQAYTLDYGHPEYGMVLLTYAWEDLSETILAIQDPHKLLSILKEQISRIMRDSSYPNYADFLEPVTDDDVYLVHWPLDQYSYGAFSLGLPGQDYLISSMFYDYQKLNDTSSSRVLINSDCTSFLGGWVDGGLQPAHNSMAAMFERFGSLNPVAAQYAPSALLGATPYQH